MNLFYTPDITENKYCLDSNESRHCIKVLRLKKGDSIHLTDGKGKLFECILINDEGRNCEVEVMNIIENNKDKKPYIHIAVAPTKNMDRMEWFIEKAVETGIDEVSFLICEHSERRKINIERLQNIAIAAIKQSHRTFLPLINDVVLFNQIINSKPDSSKFIAHFDKNNLQLKSTIQQGNDTIILIGPEGDFSKNEIEYAIQCNFVPINLGNHRLRTETAALLACHTFNLINE